MEENQVTFTTGEHLMPPKIKHELDVISAFVIQLERMDENGRRRVIAYLAAAFPSS